MRFDSADYLKAWRERGAWPQIHSALAGFAIAHAGGESLLDLGCSYGLLGAHIAEGAGFKTAIGIELDEKIVNAAVAAGVPVRFFRMKIDRAALTPFAELLLANRTDTLIARRILPELWGDDIEGGKLFAETLASCGVREIFLEGRVETERAVNPLRSIDHEVKLISGSYREVKRARPALAYLVLR